MENNTDMLKQTISHSENQIVNIINRVIERGIDDIDEPIDDYSILIEKTEFKNALITELYEVYFPPKRHEFEFELLSEIVEAIINSKITIFIAGAAASGLIGDTFTNLVKKLLNKIIEHFKSIPKESQKYANLLTDIEKVADFFKTNKKAEINQLEKELDIDKTRLIPILKLLGFKTYKEKNKRYWEKN